MFRSPYPDIVKPEYTALCGVHVRKLASIIAVIGLINCIFSVIICIYFQKFSGLAFVVVLIAAFFGILSADKFERPMGYIPYLIYKASSLVFGIIYIVLCIIVFFIPCHIVLGFVYSDEDGNPNSDTMSSDEQNEKMNFIRFVLIVMIVGIVIGECIGFYIWNIVRRARLYMIKEVASGQVKRNPVTVGYDGIEPPTYSELKV